MTTLRSLDKLKIEDTTTGKHYYGADQEWYRTFLQRKAGCGPTCAAHIIRYLSATREGFEGLIPYPSQYKTAFIKLMEDSWKYVTPRLRGVHLPEIFTQGVARFAYERGYSVSFKEMPIAKCSKDRPTAQQAIRFIGTAINHDQPVAFLNLDNGKVQNLDSWHWVTIVGIDLVDNCLLIYDQGKALTVNLIDWLHNTKMGGAFIYIDRYERAISS